MRVALVALLALTLTGCGHGPCPEPETAAAASAPETDGHANHGYLRGKPHRFDDPATWAPLWDGEERDAWQKPNQVLDLLELGVDMVVADIGTGTGYFAMRLADRVPAGHVWAVDVEPAMVRHVNERAGEEELDNVFGILGRPDDPLLPEAADVVLVVNTYHHLGDRPAYLEKLRSYLSPLGRVAIVDFKMGKRPVGPPEAAKIPPEQVVRELQAAGYEVVRDDRDTLPHQYIILAEPSA